MKSRAYILKDANTAMLIINRALDNDKLPGESMQEEFDEILKEHPEDFECLGETNKDVDQITGDLRERGIKILNPHEIDRREQNKKDNT